MRGGWAAIRATTDNTKTGLSPPLSPPLASLRQSQAFLADFVPEPDHLLPTSKTVTTHATEGSGSAESDESDTDSEEYETVSFLDGCTEAYYTCNDGGGAERLSETREQSSYGVVETFRRARGSTG